MSSQHPSSPSGGRSRLNTQQSSHHLQEMPDSLRFNNQNTILMNGISEDGRHAMMMHDSRIFYFKPQTLSFDEENQLIAQDRFHDIEEARNLALEEQVNRIRAMMLDILTTPKYRMLTTVYSVFRLGDNVVFISLMLCALFGFTLNNQILQSTEVFAVVAIELFYDVMEYTTKMWFLNRVAPYIGLILYSLYSLAFYLVHVNELVWGLLGIRFVFFFMENLVDYCIDVEIHYDLVTQTVQRLPIPRFLQCICGNVPDTPLANTEDVYCGSIPAWFCCCASFRHCKCNNKGISVQSYDRLDAPLLLTNPPSPRTRTHPRGHWNICVIGLTAIPLIPFVAPIVVLYIIIRGFVILCGKKLRCCYCSDLTRY